MVIRKLVVKYFTFVAVLPKFFQPSILSYVQTEQFSTKESLPAHGTILKQYHKEFFESSITIHVILFIWKGGPMLTAMKVRNIST